MKKTRILSLLLALMMAASSLLVGVAATETSPYKDVKPSR